ncbi:MAG: hypothetical protein LBH47_01445, partial [Christensenellaceae bacterium]|nr:hypothetical protein [Christensenellaceae bacterium]
MHVDKYAHNSSAEVDKIRNKIRKYYLFRKDAQKEAERIEKLGDEDEIKKAIEKTIEARSRIMEIFYEETKGKNLSGWDKYSKMEEIERRERWREREEEKRELKEQGLCKRAGYGQEVFPCPKVGDYVQYTPYACKENGEKNRTLRMVVSVNSDIITTIDANGQDSTDEGWLEIVLPTEEEKAEFNKMLEKKGFFTDLKHGDYVQYTPYACKENGKKNRTLRMAVSVESNIIATIDANGQKDFTDKG